MDDAKRMLTDELLALVPKLNKVLHDQHGEGASLSVFLLQSIAKTCDKKTVQEIIHDLRQYIVKQKGEDYLIGEDEQAIS